MYYGEADLSAQDEEDNNWKKWMNYDREKQRETIGSSKLSSENRDLKHVCLVVVVFYCTYHLLFAILFLPSVPHVYDYVPTCL